MAITKQTVDYVAHLSRLHLENEELDLLSKQLQDIIDFIDVLKKVNIENIEPTTHSVPSSNIFRDDLRCDSLPLAMALKNAPVKEGDFFIVPKIIE